MCGIGVVFGKGLTSSIVTSVIDVPTLSRRGPNYTGIEVVASGRVGMVATVLHVRGEIITAQPKSRDGVVMCFNGESYDSTGNDVDCIMSRIINDTGCDRVGRVLKLVKGPFACAIWDEEYQTLWIGSDPLGRRSLLAHDNWFSSVNCIGGVGDAVEVPPLGLIRIDMNTNVIKFQTWNGQIIVKPEKDSTRSWIESLETIVDINMSVPIFLPSLCSSMDAFSAALRESVRIRVVSRRVGAAIGILFSGGIDCTVLAVLVSQYMEKDEPIDLINVAFGIDSGKVDQVPDRQTSINGLLELRELCPGREWRLVEVNLSVSDIEESRKDVESRLSPQNTVMDFNIGTVLYHASKAEGRLLVSGSYSKITSEHCRYGDSKTAPGTSFDSSTVVYESYKSKATILFSGLGADELFGGYGRHRTVFRKYGQEALSAELQKDFTRLWRRNLHRDDRLISDFGRELRHPYLDTDFIRVLTTQIPVTDICDLSLPPGVGDKKILRDYAREVLKLGPSSSLQKRAIQFGTRIANKNVAGYVKLNDELEVSEIVNPLFSGLPSKSPVEYLSKSYNRKLNKPNFE